jgi:hypothetical protein
MTQLLQMVVSGRCRSPVIAISILKQRFKKFSTADCTDYTDYLKKIAFGIGSLGDVHPN